MKAKNIAVARPVPPKPSAAPPNLPAWKRWLFRSLAALLPVPILLLSLELLLRFGGYGYETALVLKDPTGEFLYENNKFLWRFHSSKTKLQPHPFRVPARKEPGEIRIVVLGESAALGTPEPAYGFWRMLDHQLRRDFPGRKIEVINCAMRGINSHIILPIAKEALQLQPDLFLVYMGNNEVVGLHAPEPDSQLSSLRVFRAIDWCKGTRCGQLLLGVTSKWVKTAADDNQDMAFFRAHSLAADDQRRLAIYRNFETNLRDLCHVATNGGAKVLLSTVAVNLKECAPLESLHRPGFSAPDQQACDAEIVQANQALAAANTNEAIKHFEAALARDDHFAEWHFRLAEALASDPVRRRREFELARDWDALQFRADKSINTAIRQTAADLRLPLIDADEIFAQHTTNSDHIPGRDLFYEHVHLRFAGDHLLAQNFYPPLLAELGLKQATNAAVTFASRDQCARWIGYTSVNQFQIEYSITQLLGTPPFLDQFQHDARLAEYRHAFTNQFTKRTLADVQADIDRYRAAIREATNDWHLYDNLGDLYAIVKKSPPALEQYQIANRLMPQFHPCRLKLARAQARAGKLNEALATLEAGLKLDPKSPLLQNALSQARASQ